MRDYEANMNTAVLHQKLCTTNFSIERLLFVIHLLAPMNIVLYFSKLSSVTYL